MNPHDLHYIFFTMAVKTICQSGTQFSTFYSHLTFPNHFQNFNMIIEYFVLLSLWLICSICLSILGFVMLIPGDICKQEGGKMNSPGPWELLTKTTWEEISQYNVSKLGWSSEGQGVRRKILFFKTRFVQNVHFRGEWGPVLSIRCSVNHIDICIYCLIELIED